MKEILAAFLLLLTLAGCRHQNGGAPAAQKPEASAESSPAARASEPASEMIGFIKNTDAVDGCGCSLYFPADATNDDRRIFLADDHHTAWMNIDGQDIELGLENFNESEGEVKKGDQSSWNYRAGDIRVRVDLIVTGVCDPDDEGCEVTSYDATIKVVNGSRRQVVKVTGICGC